MDNEGIDELASRLIEPVLDKLDRIRPTLSDSEMNTVVGNLITALVHRLVCETLAVGEGELTEEDGVRFAAMREAVEVAVETGIEVAISQTTEQDISFRCKINQVDHVVGSLPC